MFTASHVDAQTASAKSADFNLAYEDLLEDEEFLDLISRSVDHKKRTDRRFEMWLEKMRQIGL